MHAAKSGETYDPAMQGDATAVLVYNALLDEAANNSKLVCSFSADPSESQATYVLANKNGAQVSLHVRYDATTFIANIRIQPGNQNIRLHENSDEERQVENLIEHLLKPQKAAQRKSSRRLRVVSDDYGDAANYQ